MTTKRDLETMTDQQTNEARILIFEPTEDLPDLGCKTLFSKCLFFQGKWSKEAKEVPRQTKLFLL